MSAVRPRSARASSTHVTRRGRLVLVLTLAALLYAAFSFGRGVSQASTPAQAPRPTAPVSLDHVTVQPGETLWTIAQRVAPDSDPREVVQRLKRLNGVAAHELQAGQQLLLPAAA